jgi:uncharacterized protein
MVHDRMLLPEIMAYLEDREALIILGSRQVGKTTLMKIIMERVSPPSRTFYLDLEDPHKLEIVQGGPDNLLDYMIAQGASGAAKNFVFIDEIHYMDNPSRFLKLIVDHYSEKIKVICSGSSSLDMKLKLHDSIAGRKLIFTLYPLNFGEFLSFKKKDSLALALPAEPFIQDKDPTRFSFDEYSRLFVEFMIFGGYPRVVLEDDYDKKEKLLGEIVGAYIYRDIRSLFSIGDISKFNNLVKLLAAQIGSPVNISELSKVLGSSRLTVANYLSILEHSFVLSTLPPYSVSERVEIRKAHKIYFLDNGLRNYIIGDLSPSSARGDLGPLLENAIFSGLIKRKKELHHLHYWRTKDGAEVDFIYDEGKNRIPIEAKAAARPHRGIKAFMKKYGIQRGFIAHLGPLEKGDISHLPAFWLA